jgi:hypothetical protein
MLYKDYDGKGSVEKNAGREFEGDLAPRQTDRW